MLLPHTSRPLRDTNDRELGHPDGRGTLSHHKIGDGRYGRPTRIPRKSPRRANPNAASPRGQFTLSYRLLPFSGRTPVWSSPKMRSGEVRSRIRREQKYSEKSFDYNMITRSATHRG